MPEVGKSAVLLVAMAALASASASAGGPRVERASPPAQAPPALRAAVARECAVLDLDSPAGGKIRVWPARRIKAAAPQAPEEPAYMRERVAYAIEPGSLVAVASWDSGWHDYRDQPIPAGTYALLYAVQPAIKEHRGVSEFRDVLLVIPARDAAGPVHTGDLSRAVAASRGVSGTSHPAVLALFPAGRAGPLPRVTEAPRGGRILEVLAGGAGGIPVGIAVSGKGRLEGAEP
jgi:hypothetical protein